MLEALSAGDIEILVAGVDGCAEVETVAVMKVERW
jgi:hypothetical protein